MTFPASELDAVCRSEASRVVFALRGNRRFGARSWRDLEETSPLRQLCSWRLNGYGPNELLEPLLRVIRSPDFAGPATFVALEATQNVVVAICEEQRSQSPEALRHFATTLVEVCRAACDCVFEETNAQTDEATAAQMIALIGLCCSAAPWDVSNGEALEHQRFSSQPLEGPDAVLIFSPQDRVKAFSKVLQFWSHYRESHTLRASAQATLQRMLDLTLVDLTSPARYEFLRVILGMMAAEAEPGMPMERALLYLRCLQRLAMHSSSRRWAISEQGRFFQNDIPLLLLSFCKLFPGSLPLLTLLLPVVNRICWLCVDFWADKAAASSAALGALQVDALLSGVYIRSLDYAVAPLITSEAAPMTPEEAVHLVELLLESLYDLFQPSLVQAVWFSFDGDWRRPPLLEQVAGKVVELVTKRPPSSERPLPAQLMHLSSAVLTRIVSAFVDVEGAEGGKSSDGLERLQRQWQLRSDLRELMTKIEESPKKARGAFEKSSLAEVVPLPPGSSCEASEEWVFKLIWLFRTVHFLVPYSAVGEFFGQPKEDSEKAVTTFSESFDWGAADIEKALRSFLEAFLLPKEAQQIDRILRVFAHAYYHKHVEHCRSSGKEGAGYLKHPDAAYTFAFSVILLNSDQHNPKLKKRMSVKDFISNNRGINEGEDIPQEVQVQVFESIRQDEIKTPSSGSFIEGISRTRWEDFLNLTRKGWRDNSLTTQSSNLTGQAAGFLQRCSQSFRDVLEYSLACEGGAESFAAVGLEQLLRLALQLQRPEADRAAESLFFFASEVFHEAESEMVLARGASCLRALVRTAKTSAAPSWSTKHIHLLVYLTVQFAVYGVFEKVLPPIDAATRKLLLSPVLLVDPPTGVVYSFLRKISTAPFKMLSFAEDGVTPSGQGSALRSASAPVHAEEESSSPPPPPRLKSAGALRSGIQEVHFEVDDTETATSEDSNEAQNMPEEPDSEGFLQKDPMKPQIQRLFEASDFDHFLKVMLDPWLQVSRTPTPSPRIKATCGGGDAGAGSGRLSNDGGPATATESTSASSNIQLFLCYLSSLFLALRAGASKPGKEDLPFWPQDASSLGIPQSLQLPKRTLQLNVLDGYDTLRLATRLLLTTVGHRSAKCLPWEAPAMQELSVCAHVGILYTLRRKDLNERTLKFSIMAIFQIGSSLLTLEDAGISTGWPVRLIEALVNRTEAEPHLLVPHCKLVVEVVRSFIQASSGRLESPELWRAIFQLLLRCIPTSQRALWPGAKDKEVESLQLYLWQHGLVGVLSHPELRDSHEAEGKPNDADANNFWGWAITEMTTLAQEMAGQRGMGSIRLLLYAYRTILQSVAEPNGDDASPREEVAAGEESPGDSFPGTGAGEPTADRAAKGAAWSRVAIGMLNFVGPAIGRPMDEPDLSVLPLLKQALLHARVPSLLAAGPHGPFWARSVLEKLVSVLTGPVTSQTPLKVVREAVSLVSKFFLQNLQTLQRHDCFGQLWLMVLRLMLQFIKRGSDDQDAELEEVATETLRNLLGVLVSSNILGFVSKSADSTPPVWWQMTWDCIEVFIPGFGEDFSKSLLGSPAAKEASAMPDPVGAT